VSAVLLTVGTLEPHGVINNGADNTAPIALAHAVAESVNALIAPHIPYGVTGALAPYPGGLHVAEAPFRAYVRAGLDGPVKTRFTGKEMATPNPEPGAWSATPFPSSITLYKPGKGLPKDFDQKKADEYYKKVVAKVEALIKDTFRKWTAAGFR